MDRVNNRLKHGKALRRQANTRADYNARIDRLRPQSSTASRVTAGAFGFLTVSQCRGRPERYGEPSRSLTIPSQPSWQAASKTSAPSSSKCSFRTMLRCEPLRSSASSRLRSSIGCRRRSLPSSSSRSNHWVLPCLGGSSGQLIGRGDRTSPATCSVGCTPTSLRPNFRSCAN